MVSDFESYRKRVISQGWFQGALVPWVGGVAAAAAAEGLPLTAYPADEGHPASTETEGDGHLLLISQACDIVAPFDDEPFAACISYGEMRPDRELPGANSSRILVIDRDRGLVAVQTRLIQFDKRLLPDFEATAAPIQPAILATWCARRWRRIPLPDAFVATVVALLTRALKQKGVDSYALGATHCWRADLSRAPSAQLIAVYDPRLIEHADFSDHVKNVHEFITSRLDVQMNKIQRKAGAQLTPYVLEATHPVGIDEWPVSDALDTTMITFDYLSTTADSEDDESDGGVPELPEDELY